jgi:hypothetical protein
LPLEYGIVKAEIKAIKNFYAITVFGGQGTWRGLARSEHGDTPPGTSLRA